MMPGNALSPQKSMAIARIVNGANWFLWIAGMSLINSVISLFGAKIHFILGLGLTEIIDSIPSSTTGHVIALVCDLAVAGVWVLFSLQAKKGKSWAFIAGMILYLLDAVLLILGQDLLSIGFHVYALFRIFPGFQAIAELRRIEEVERQQAAMAAVQTGYNPGPSGVWPPPPAVDPSQPGVYPPSDR